MEKLKKMSQGCRCSGWDPNRRLRDASQKHIRLRAAYLVMGALTGTTSPVCFHFVGFVQRTRSNWRECRGLKQKSLNRKSAKRWVWAHRVHSYAQCSRPQRICYFKVINFLQLSRNSITSDNLELPSHPFISPFQFPRKDPALFPFIWPLRRQESNLVLLHTEERKNSLDLNMIPGFQSFEDHCRISKQSLTVSVRNSGGS